MSLKFCKSLEYFLQVLETLYKVVFWAYNKLIKRMNNKNANSNQLKIEDFCSCYFQNEYFGIKNIDELKSQHGGKGIKKIIFLLCHKNKAEIFRALQASIYITIYRVNRVKLSFKNIYYSKLIQID